MVSAGETEPLVVAHKHALTGESPTWDDMRDCLWWIDIQGQRLLSSSSNGSTREYALPSMPGFVVLDRENRLIIGLEDGLWSFLPETNKHAMLKAIENDRPHNRLNDPGVDTAGRLLFGSMDKFNPKLASGAPYVWNPGGAVDKVLDNIPIPNSIAFAPAMPIN